MKNKITLYTETVLDSCHNLNGYDGKCRNMHGHSWLIKLWIQGIDEQKDSVGILFDFGELSQIKDKFDHKNINEILEDCNPTAENMSLIFLNMLKTKYEGLEFRIRVYETAVLKETFCQRQTEGFDVTYC